MAILSGKESKNIKEILMLKSFEEYQKRIFISTPPYIKKKKNKWLPNYLKFSNNIYQQIADLNIKLWLDNDSNVKVDRASMAYSLEVRSPFLDYRLVELAREVPIKYRYSKNKRKQILKNILDEYIPSHIYNNPKKGFSIPLNQWTRGKLKKDLLRKLSKKNLSNIPGLNHNIFLELMRKHYSDKIDFSLEIWRMYILISWYQQNTVNIN